MAIQSDRTTTINSPNSHNSQMMGNGARYLNVLIGAWLFISAFAWRHPVHLRQDSWIVGFLIFVTALIAIGAPAFRWVNTVLALWLFFSTLAFRHTSSATLWNNLIIAVVVFLLSLVPSSKPSSAGSVLGRHV